MERFTGERGTFFTYEEERLLISVLEGDSQGTWGDDRGEQIKALIRKIKRGKVGA